MKNRLLRYEDFRIDESVSLLLEANIAFSEEFENLLDRMDSVTADKLLNLIGKDIDVNTNYIDVDIEKDGFVKFVADDKAEKVPFIVQAFPTYYLQLSKDFGLKDVDQNSALMQGMRVELLKRYSKREFLEQCEKAHGEEKMDSWKELADTFYGAGSAVCVVTFEIRGMRKEVLCHSDAIKRDISGIKPGSLKIGKLATALFTKAGVDFKPTDIEDFVNRYKSVVKQMREKFDSFKVVKGEEIRKCYHQENYLNTNGSLGNSCMRYDKCQKFLDIYAQNEDVCSLVVLFEGEKVAGRALLWTDSEGRKIMDRIYTNNSANEQLFKDFAKSSGFWHKESQDMYADTPFVSPEGSKEGSITIDIKKGEYRYYPYMDSMKYYNYEDGLLTNDSEELHQYELTDTDGGNGSCDECGGNGTVTCGDCDGDREISCGECDGNGEIECSTCEGEGKEECDYCDGEGDMECSTCDGSGKVEGDDGEEEDCSDCGGEGREKCVHCDGEGSRECGNCNGSGERTCRYCDGDGNVECGECGGDGEVSCPDCN
jgi:hypothetical protein